MKKFSKRLDKGREMCYNGLTTKKRTSKRANKPKKGVWGVKLAIAIVLFAIPMSALVLLFVKESQRRRSPAWDILVSFLLGLILQRVIR